jgi:hypothetical protein
MRCIGLASGESRVFSDDIAATLKAAIVEFKASFVK